MKKYIIVISTIIIAIIAIIITIIALNNKSNRLVDLYNKIIKSNEYYFKGSSVNNVNEIIIAKKDKKVIIDMSNHNFDEHITTLMTDNETYLVYHNIKEYGVYSAINEEEKDVFTNDLNGIINSEYTSGDEIVNGTKYYYEEYKTNSNFVFFNQEQIDEGNVYTRFYFKGDNLKYIKTVYKEINEENGEIANKEELLKIDFRYNVEEKLFQIPNDYAESIENNENF